MNATANHRPTQGNFIDIFPGLAGLLMVNFAFFALEWIMHGKLPDQIKAQVGQGFVQNIHPDVTYVLGSASMKETLTGQYWRIMAATFLHAGFLHVGMNCYILFQMGKVLEPLVGTARFLSVYLISGFIGSIASVCWRFGSIWLNVNGHRSYDYFTIWFTDRAYSMSDVLSQLPYGLPGAVGASGAVFGLFGVLLGYSFRHKDKDLFRQIGFNIVIIVLISMGIGGRVNIDHAGHIGGLVAGALLGYFVPRYTTSQTTQKWKIPCLLTTGLTAVCLGFAVWNHFKDQFQ